MSARRPRRRQVGTVTSDAMDKTIAVRVDWLYAVPKYGKRIRRHTTYYAHDEHNNARVGDEVEIVATRPLSKLKRWRLAQVIRRSSLGAEAREGAVNTEAEAAEALAAAAPEPETESVSGGEQA